MQMTSEQWVCAAKVTEVEKLMQGNIQDVLLTNEIVAKSKLKVGRNCL